MRSTYAPCELDKISVEIAEVNRPGLFLAGYYDYFDKLRLQIMGLAEMNFLAGLAPEKRRERLDQLFRQQPPAVIVCRSEELEPFPEMLELAQQHKVALLRSNEMTCTLMGSLISVLNLELAPRITRHGVLVEVYGEGILHPGRQRHRQERAGHRAGQARPPPRRRRRRGAAQGLQPPDHGHCAGEHPPLH